MSVIDKPGFYLSKAGKCEAQSHRRGVMLKRLKQILLLEPSQKQPYRYSFSMGDKVRLKSGGPMMTVAVEVNADAAYWTGVDWGVHCSWFDEGNARHAVFWPAQLEKAEA